MSRRVSSLFRKSIASLLLCGASSFAHAYVECVVNPARYYVGSDGFLWIVWAQGGVGKIASSNAGNRSMLATVITAMNSNRRLVVRFPAGASCSAENDLVGMWLET
jgi:hypothetical protein